MAEAKTQKAKKSEDDLSRFTGGLFNPVIDKCDGCERIVATGKASYCRTYVEPEAKWRLGICNFATHVKPEIAVAQAKVNPLKASKRAMAKKK